MPEESVSDYAKREGISERRVRALIHGGKLSARQVGRQWLIDQASVHRPAPSRPLSVQMGAGLIAAISGHTLPEMSAPERRRLRSYLSELRGAAEPDRILSAWIPQHAPLRLAAAPGDLDDLGRDARVVKTGFSDSRAQIAAAGHLEARVAEAALNGLQREYLLRPSDRPNVLLHIEDEVSSSPVPLGLLLVDLAHHSGVRERSRVADLLKELPL